VLAFAPGRVVTGHDEIRGVYRELLADRPVFTSAGQRPSLRNGGLALSRPPPQHLTRFYLTLSLGGAAGAVLIGLIAPAVMNVDFDLEIGMVACALLVLWRIRRWSLS